MRTIKEYFNGKQAQDGAGVKLLRCFGYYDLPKFDPYLMMDFFDSTDSDDYIKGFPWHPHRGIDTITYLIEGEIEHSDSMGNTGMIKAGECQWMSAGSGILHQEMPQKSPSMLGSQIWLNLSREEKMKKPEYRNIDSEMIKVVEEAGINVKILAGEYKGVPGPIILEKTKPIYLDIELEKDREFVLDLEEELNAFAFVIRGSVKFDYKEEKYLEAANGVLFNMDSDIIKFRAGKENTRLILLAGKPLNEEISWGGPIVMNTSEELSKAFEELENGNFIKD